MSWWKWLWGRKTRPTDARLQQVRLTMEGWHDEGTKGEMRGWRDNQGDLILLAPANQAHDIPFSDEVALQSFFRSLAESQGGGLIEVNTSSGPLGRTASVIYKRLPSQAYIFTGMLVAPDMEPPQVWSIIAEERGTTGLREATITAELFNVGIMTIQDYESSWAKDPYDANYQPTDRSVLRFVSDDESYDERFPQHPLSKVRRTLVALPYSVT